MIDYRPARRDDGPALAEMARRTFRDTFAHLYRPADLDAFLETTFGASGLPAQIGDPACDIRIAVDGGAIAGFAKAGRCSLPAPADPRALELKQLYVAGRWQGAGIAAALMDWTIATARDRGAPAVVLGVFVDNHRAKRFYARYGFVEVGAAPFAVGTQIDDDRIWSLPL